MSISTTAAYLELTREGIIRDANYILNDTAKRSYTIQRLVAAKPADAVVRKGDKILEELKLTQTGNYSEFAPGDRVTVNGGITRVPASYHWRFARNHKPFNKYQTTLNNGSDPATVIKNLAKQIRADLAQDHVDGMENRIWGPVDATMETTGEMSSAKPFSIPTYITEQVAPVGLAGTGTVANVNFSTYTKWDNQRYGYDSTDPFGANGLLKAFDEMQVLVRFTPPTGKGSEAFSPDMRSRMFIFTNRDGLSLYKAACRAGNDRFHIAGNDPAYRSVMWDGVTLEHAAQLDEALLEQSSGTAYSSAVYTAGKPRYFWVNPEYLWPNFHPEHHMNEVVKDGGAEYPDMEVAFYESMWQVVCTSRRRQGLICPQASWVTNSTT